MGIIILGAIMYLQDWVKGLKFSYLIGAFGAVFAVSYFITDYFIADDYIQKITPYHRFGHQPTRVVKISEIKTIEIIRKRGKMKGLIIYNTDNIIPRATISVKEPERFLKFILKRNPQIEVID
ncbi:MAG: hypothetical protein AB8G22_02335 [Saprospiraceae bacterium]